MKGTKPRALVMSEQGGKGGVGQCNHRCAGKCTDKCVDAKCPLQSMAVQSVQWMQVLQVLQCNKMCNAFVGALQFVLWDLHSLRTSWVCSVYCAAAVSSVGFAESSIQRSFPCSVQLYTAGHKVPLCGMEPSDPCLALFPTLIHNSLNDALHCTALNYTIAETVLFIHRQSSSDVSISFCNTLVLHDPNNVRIRSYF